MKTHLKFAFLFAAAIFSILSNQVRAEEDAAAKILTIGSKAPALNIENWVSNGNGQFKEVTTFDSGKVYVVEFWATWCGPCVSSMPHLSKTQEQYAKKGVQLISVSSEELETVEKFLLGEVRGGKPGQTYGELTSNYCLTCDSDQSTSKDYMKAAGQKGIPCAFLVGKTGLIEWIGHPMGMDEALEQVVDNSWNREAFAATFKQQKMFESIIQPQVLAAYRGGDFDKAVEVLDKALTTLTDKQLVAQATSMRRAIILLGGGEKAVKEIALFLEKNKQDNAALDKMGKMIYMMAARSQVKAEVVKAGIELAKQTHNNTPKSSDPLELLSHLYHVHGDIDQAIEAQKKAAATFTANKKDVPKEISGFLDKLLAEKKELATRKQEEKKETEAKPKS